MKIAIVVNLTKEKAIDCARKIAEIFQNAGADVILPPDCTEVLSDCGAVFAESIEQLFEIAEIAVTVGGDGTIIHAAKYAAVTNTPLIGVNVGRMGFAADVELNEIGDLKKLVSGDYFSEDRTLLDVELETAGGSYRYLAVNDAVVTHGQLSKIVDFTLFLNGEEISRYRADGLLFSTPTGTPAYSLSAGGPILSPQMACILLTPVCPHSLFSRSVVFGADEVLSVEVKIPAGCSCILSIDGEINLNIDETDKIHVRKSNQTLTLISIRQRNFYRKLNKKLKEREL